MRNRNPGLNKNDLEKVVYPLITQHFNNADIVKNKSLFKALRQLCVCSEAGPVSASKKATEQLSKIASYVQIQDFLLNPIGYFKSKSLELKKSDEPEVRYAIQKKLFELICKKISVLKTDQKYSDWMEGTRKTLTERHRALPKVTIIPPNYERARFHGRQIFFSILPSLLLLPVAYMSNITGKNIGKLLDDLSVGHDDLIVYKEVVDGIMGWVRPGLILCVLLLGIRRIKDDVNGLIEAMWGKTIQRTIFAKPPEKIGSHPAESSLEKKALNTEEEGGSHLKTA